MSTVPRSLRSFVLFLGAALASAQPSPDTLIESGHWLRARALVEAKIAQAPSDARANFLLSQIRAAFGDRETPLSLAEKAAALDPSTARYHRQIAEILGIVAQQAGSVQQLFLARRFRKEIDLALTLDPHDVQAMRDLVEFYILAPGIIGGDAEKANAMATRIAVADPVQGALAWARLAAFRKQTVEAQAIVQHAADRLPANYAILAALAQLCVSPDHPNTDTAAHAANQALRLDNTRVDAYSVLAAIYAERSAWNDLDTLLTSAQKNIPDDLTPFFRAAERITTTGLDLPRAERYLRVYLSQPREGNEPTPAEAHWRLGQILERQSRGVEAVNEWKEAISLDPSSPAKVDLKRARAGHP